MCCVLYALQPAYEKMHDALAKYMGSVCLP